MDSDHVVRTGSQCEIARIGVDKPARGVDVIALDEALSRLTRLYPDQGRLVELRFFGGLTIEETGEAMGLSPATVKRQWTVARAWLLHNLNGDATS
jgi:RNA polymerase sigma factor (sigma-70 family)